jgi:hypothetical protein
VELAAAVVEDLLLMVQIPMVSLEMQIQAAVVVVVFHTLLDNHSAALVVQVLLLFVTQ